MNATTTPSNDDPNRAALVENIITMLARGDDAERDRLRANPASVNTVLDTKILNGPGGVVRLANAEAEHVIERDGYVLALKEAVDFIGRVTTLGMSDAERGLFKGIQTTIIASLNDRITEVIESGNHRACDCCTGQRAPEGSPFEQLISELLGVDVKVVNLEPASR